jgi:hypothetical protein
MKKFFKALICTLLCGGMVAGFAACKPSEQDAISVYAPDGAPALAIARLIADDSVFANSNYNVTVNYHVVTADDILGHVSFDDETKNADICILPVYDAVKTLGTGEQYKLLGTVTKGNLYVLGGEEAEALTRQNVEEVLSNKTVGVVQLPKFPGLMTKVVLAKYSLSASVSLVAKTPQTLNGCDYYVVPEPAASTLCANTNLHLACKGSLQELYGQDDGYPQAVVVAKNSLLTKNPQFVADFMNAFSDNKAWLTASSTTPQQIIDAISSALPEGTTPTFSAANLNATVIANCGIDFTKAADCKTAIISFMDKLNGVAATSYGMPQDAFFYTA